MSESFASNSSASTALAQTRFRILGAISFSHFLNDMIQSLIVAIYPLIKGEFQLNFMQIGAITLTYQVCASVLQPIVGIYTDKHPKPRSLSVGMGFTLIGLLTLSLEPRSIPGARHVPIEEVGRHIADLPRDLDIVLYCACPSEASAARVAKILMSHCFNKVRPLHGGLDAWMTATQ
jgi:rhodanese-related sulfurtransferase